MKYKGRWPWRGLVLLTTAAVLSVLAWAVAHGGAGVSAPPWPVAGSLGWPLVLAL